MRTLLIATLLLPACVDYRFGTRRDPPEIEVPGCVAVEPESVSFEDTAVGEWSEELVTISNPCEGWLEVYTIELADDPSLFDLGEVGDVLLRGEESTDFTIQFAPLGEGEWHNTVRIETDDPDQQLVEVPIAGRSGG